MINSIRKIDKIRKKLKSKNKTFGTWMQIPNSEIAEILSNCGFDWITVDMEHGNFNFSDLTNIFRAIELGSAAPLVRMPNSNFTLIRQVLDFGAAGIILPNIESPEQLENCIKNCNWPPQGTRGVGFSRANLFGINFNKYKNKKTKPLVVAIIESKKGYENLDKILKVKDLDSIFIGPYDLSASMNILGKFNSAKFKKIINEILKKCRARKVPCGIHVVDPDIKKLKNISKQFQFIAYSIDAQFIISGADKIKDINKK